MPSRHPKNDHAPRSRLALMTLAPAMLLLAACAPAAPEADDAGTSQEIPEVVILGQDYAFELAEPVPAGTVHFVFENVGDVPHEAVLVQLNEGVTADQVAAALQGQADPETLMAGVAGILIADPGETAMGRLTVDLESGRTYALLCNFTDTDQAPPHIALGMMRIFQAT